MPTENNILGKALVQIKKEIGRKKTENLRTTIKKSQIAYKSSFEESPRRITEVAAECDSEISTKQEIINENQETLKKKDEQIH